MGKELELLQKMDLTAENRQKLEALITEAKKTGKVSSKHLVETLDDVDATQEQTEQFYNILEQSGIEIDVSDVLDLIGTADMDNPTLSEMQAIEDEGLPADLDEPEALPEDVFQRLAAAPLASSQTERQQNHTTTQCHDENYCFGLGAHGEHLGLPSAGALQPQTDANRTHRTGRGGVPKRTEGRSVVANATRRQAP